MNRVLASVVFSSVIFLVGCSSAQKASEVQVAHTPISPYLKMECRELLSEQSHLLDKVAAARSAVDDAYQSDKSTELVTWLLFFPAAVMLEGNQKEATALSVAQGQYNAIKDAIAVNGCMASNEPTQKTVSSEKGNNGNEENSPNENKGVEITSQLQQLNQLHKSGSLTDEEYSIAKKRILSGV